MAWLGKIAEYLRWDQPKSLCRWREMGMRPAMPLTSSDGEVLKVPVIYRAAWHWSLLSS